MRTTSAALTGRFDLDSLADAALGAAARLWFLVAAFGLLGFLAYIVTFYGPSTLSGNFQDWGRNTMLRKGYVAGDGVGNLFFAAHVLLAAVVTLGGVLQIVPQIRARALGLHRWNGRVFLVTAVATSVGGLYLTWVRGGGSGLSGNLAITLNALLVVVCAALAWRTARAGDVTAHRRWALRAFLVVNGVWFIRVGVGAWMLIDHHSLGTFFRLWNFGSYLVPLAVLELYLRAREGAGPGARLALAGALLLLTALTGAGIFGFALMRRSFLG